MAVSKGGEFLSVKSMGEMVNSTSPHSAETFHSRLAKRLRLGVGTFVPLPQSRRQMPQGACLDLFSRCKSEHTTWSKFRCSPPRAACRNALLTVKGCLKPRFKINTYETFCTLKKSTIQMRSVLVSDSWGLQLLFDTHNIKKGRVTMHFSSLLV